MTQMTWPARISFVCLCAVLYLLISHARGQEAENGIQCQKFVPADKWLAMLQEKFHETVKARLHGADGSDIFLTQSPDGKTWTLMLAPPGQKNDGPPMLCPFANDGVEPGQGA